MQIKFDLLRKLRRMSPDELRARSRYLMARYCEEAGHRLGLERNPDRDVSPDAASSTFKDPWIDQDEQRAVVDELRAKHPDYVEELIKTADAICRHEFTLFGSVVRYGETVEWQADPLSTSPWPSDFHTRVRIFDGNSGNGDVKYVWELNRHQFLRCSGKRTA